MTRYGPVTGRDTWLEIPPTRDKCKWCRSRIGDRYCSQSRIRELAMPFETDAERERNAIKIERAIVVCCGDYFTERSRGRWP
jgi:hypothetical protein